MIRGLYSSATAMEAMTLRQDAIAQNLAHVNMPGYRRHVVALESLRSPAEILGTRGTEHTNFSAGPFITTGNPLDLALSQSGFFVLQGPGGESLYTRNGTFWVNRLGQIVSHAKAPGDIASTLPLLGENGPIVIPADTTNLSVRADGMVVADGLDVDRVRVRRFRNPDKDLLRAGTTLFRTRPDVELLPVDAGPEEGGPPRDEVLAGIREGSNVNSTGQLVEMLTSLRQFEAAQRALRTLGEAIRLRTRPQ